MRSYGIHTTLINTQNNIFSSRTNMAENNGFSKLVCFSKTRVDSDCVQTLMSVPNN